MTIKEIYKLSKSLNDSDLQKLINKLTTHQTDRAAKLAESQKAEQERAEKAKQAIEQIEQKVKASGLSLAKLGLSSPLGTNDTPVNAAQRKSKRYSPENQKYAIIDDNLVEILFGRKAGILKREGKAISFDELNPKQQKNAVTIVSRLNER